MKAIIFRDWKEFNAAKNWIICSIWPITVLIMCSVLSGMDSDAYRKIFLSLGGVIAFTPLVLGVNTLTDDKESGLINIFHSSGHAPFTYICAKMIIPLVISILYFLLCLLYGSWSGALSLNGILYEVADCLISIVCIILIGFAAGFPICLMIRNPMNIIFCIAMAALMLVSGSMGLVESGNITIATAAAILLVLIGGTLALGLLYYHRHYPTTLAAMQ